MARDYYTLQPVHSVLCPGKGHVLSVARQHGILAWALSMSILLSQQEIVSPKNDIDPEFQRLVESVSWTNEAGLAALDGQTPCLFFSPLNYLIMFC